MLDVTNMTTQELRQESMNYDVISEENRIISKELRDRDKNSNNFLINLWDKR